MIHHHKKRIGHENSHKKMIFPTPTFETQCKQDVTDNNKKTLWIRITNQHKTEIEKTKSSQTKPNMKF